MNECAINIQNLTVQFGQKKAITDLTFSVGKGEVVGIIGPTAAGKTVLLKTLAGLYRPHAGAIEIGGEDISARGAGAADRIGMLFQQNALFDSLPVWENIAFRLIADGMDRDQARQHAEALLPRVGLPAANADLFPADLSGGMQKRVGFARAIATQPDILLLDNPTAGLDPILAARVDGMISTLARESGACVISVTSNMVGLTEAYDEIAVLHDGVLRWHGATSAAQSDDNPWLRQLLAGSRDGPISTMNNAA